MGGLKETKKIFGAFYKLWIEKEKPPFQQERLDICAKCDERTGVICGVCLCYLKAKSILPEEKCPREKWPEI